MACCPTEKSYGYESCRFEKEVDEHFHCSICYNVLKEPRTCRNNDHMFCLDCITEHLKVNSQACPECDEHLSLDTVRRPRVVNNILSKLKIKCDYASRGCPEFVCVEELQTHVEDCGFAPVLCSNEECGMEINKQDKVHHETEVCEYRKVKSHDYGQIQEIVERLEGKLMESDKNLNNNHVEMKRIVGKMEEGLVGINKRINEKVETIQNSHNQMKRDQQEVKKDVEEVMKEVKDVKEKVEAIKKSHDEMKRDQQEVKKDVQEVKKEVKGVKDNLSKVNKDVDEVKILMSQMLEKLNRLEQLRKLTSPTEGMMKTPRENILITGGNGPSENVEQNTEIYSWEKNGWFEMSKMNEEHEGASSFFYKGQLFVVGGEDSKAIETLDLNELPLKWMKFPGELPYAFDDHQTVAYQQRIIRIGGYSFHEKEVSNVISELQLSSPCIMKELCRMPEPRQCHGAEIFEDKVLIMGGEKEVDAGVLDSVLEFDVTRKKCREMPPLPRALKRMATVRWRDKVVVLGGQDEDSEVLNDVFMYDCKTGKTTALPSMLEKRSACCAVVTGNTIVVMGGFDEKHKDLDSVECLTMGSSTWEYLLPMNEARSRAIAEVLPSTRKYV